MELHAETIATNLYQSRKGAKATWMLRKTWILNSMQIRWGRSNQSARLILKPAIGPEMILCEASEGVDQTFDFAAADGVFKPILPGDKSIIRLECPQGSANVFIKLNVDIEGPATEA